MLGGYRTDVRHVPYYNIIYYYLLYATRSEETRATLQNNDNDEQRLPLCECVVDLNITY
jgi:hypothetical protein